MLKELRRRKADLDTAAARNIDVFKVLGYVPTERQRLFHDAAEYDVLYGGAAGGGKGGRCPDRAAPSYDPEVETQVLTPKGFKLIGDVAVGDQVSNPDGTTARVIGVFDNGPKQFYRVTLADGSTVEADEDHLWAISIAGARTRRKTDAPVIPAGLRPQDEWNLRVGSRARIVNTVELARLVARADDEKARGLRPHYVQIPLTNPVAMTGVPGRWPKLSPYILGAIIGDGSAVGRSVSLSGLDAQVFDRIRTELPEHLQLVTRPEQADRCQQYAISRRDGEGESANGYLKRDGLDGCRSWEKFVPARLLVAPVADRFAFVQGLMDTDGHMDDRGHVEFVTVSERLATGMQAMLRSLGYRATLGTKTPTYEYAGEKRDGRLAYRLYIQGRHLDRLFHLDRKRAGVAQFNGGDVEPWHRITSVTPTEVDNSRCIQVDNLNHLYVTDDYIVTHNTKALLMDDLRDAMRYPGVRIGAFRRTYGELKESLLAELASVGYARALGAIWNGSNYELRFPNGSLILYRYAESVVDATRRQGGQYQKLTFDERNLTNPEVISFLESRVRSGNAAVPVIGIRSGTNPGGPGHGASKGRYVDPTEHGKKVYKDVRDRTVRFIPSKLADNPHVNPEYAMDLQALDGKLRAAFLDGNWDVFAGQYFCYDNKVDILTISGWKPVADVQLGEHVATLSPDGEMSFAPATGVWQFPFDGNLFVHEGRALNFAVTPGHKMWTKPRKSQGPFRFIAVDDLPDSSVHLRAAQQWNGDDRATVTITAPGVPEAAAVASAEPGACIGCDRPAGVPRKGFCDACYRVWRRAGRPEIAEFRRARHTPASRHARHKSYTLDAGDWCELLGWYLSEGFTERASGGSRYAGRIMGFGISQSASQEKRDRIGSLLTRMGLPYTLDKSRFRVRSRVLGEYFAQFGHHHDKFIPRDVLALAVPHLQRLFEALMAGDGHTRASGGGIYASASRQLADDVQELCARLDRVATVTEVPSENERHRTQYRVSIYRPGRSHSVLNRDDIRREHYDGVVSCVTVEPYHTVLVRRGGKAMWSGNTSWKRERHVVEPVTLPSSWKRFNGLDWGFAAPWAVLWGAVDEDGRVWIYRELYATQVGESEQARRILAVEGDDEHVSVRYADDAMWATRGDAKAIAAVYAENGVHLTPAGKQQDAGRVGGWQRVRSYLEEGPACPHHRAQGWETCPMMHVFSTVENLIRTLPTLPHAVKGNVEDLDTASEDHIADALRYMLVNLGGGPQFLTGLPAPDPEKTTQTAPQGTFVIVPPGAGRGGQASFWRR